MDRQDFDSRCALGVSGIAALNVGQRCVVDNVPGSRRVTPEDREFVFTLVRHHGKSNVREVDDLIAGPLERSGGHREDGLQLECPAHQRQLHEGQSLQTDLGQYAADHSGLATDNTAQAQLIEAIAQAQGGSNTAPDAPGGKATISLTAPEGIAATTPHTIVHSAGKNIDHVAGLNIQHTAARNIAMHAGQGLSLFARQDGARLIANQGPILLQSQNDITQLDALKDIRVTSIEGGISLLSKKPILIGVMSGHCIRISDDGIELLSDKPLKVKTNGHHWEGPQTLTQSATGFAQGLVGRVPHLLRPTDGKPVEGIEVVVQAEEGDIVNQSQTAGDGTAGKIITDGFKRLKTFFYAKRS